jgi:hypothetical protein
MPSATPTPFSIHRFVNSDDWNEFSLDADQNPMMSSGEDSMDSDFLESPEETRLRLLQEMNRCEAELIRAVGEGDQGEDVSEEKVKCEIEHEPQEIMLEGRGVGDLNMVFNCAQPSPAVSAVLHDCKLQNSNWH